MSDIGNMLLLLTLCAIVALWLKLSVARERAAHEARQLCLKHGLQLLDETVGLRALRLRRINGLRRVERGYGFEVSVDGNDREPGRLWMIGNELTGLSLPTIDRVSPDSIVASKEPALVSNVVQLRPPNRLH
jgi:hypothetical protein